MVNRPDSTSKEIRHVADLIRGSKKGVVLTGAGISTPSGIPDFRSPNSGLWERYDPMDVASLSAFRYHPETFFNWMLPLAIGIHNAEPNPAHNALVRLEQAGYMQTVITQNIDRLHQRAGSKSVLEVHGSLESLTCIFCFQQVDSCGYLEPYIENGRIPRCPKCDNILKPNVILFGEQLPSRTWQLALQASKQCDLMIVAGSSLEVLPVAGLPMRALESGAPLIILNNANTYLDERADVVCCEDLAITLPRIAAEVLKD